MSKYNLFIFFLLTFCIGFAVGAKTFHPAVIINYETTTDAIKTCKAAGGEYTVSTVQNTSTESCNIKKSEEVFSHTLQ